MLQLKEIIVGMIQKGQMRKLQSMKCANSPSNLIEKNVT